MSSKLAFNEEIFKSHEAAFIEHYDWLRRWALQLTNHDRERAEDLVQEVFAQFAIAHTDLSAVQNIPAYLYTTLRNIHVSQVRLAGRSHNQSQSIVDYSGVEAALEATDPYTNFHTQDQLRRVCQYACLRKQSSRSGSVLILRYFHGYHLSEVAEVLRATFQAVRQQLTFARNEARVFLENPQALKLIQQSQIGFTTGTNSVCSADRLLLELRNAIFDSRQGDCISSETLKRLYTQGLITAADNPTVAHIVSCPVCLDQVNARLGLPLLAERHPADTLGPNNDWRDGTRGPRDSGGSGCAVPSRRRGKTEEEKPGGPLLLQCRRRATELFEHYPRELCVSVNGHVLGSQSVSSPVSRLRLDVTIAEELNFVEVLSEERARLLVMTIEPPPHGEPVQYRRLRLSENRNLEVTFHYGHPWPMVEVMYDEPSFLAESQPLMPVPGTPAAVVRSLGFSDTPFLKTEACQKPRLVGLWSDLRSLWLRPGLITAVVSLVLIGILLTYWLERKPSITAANVLERANAQESLSVPANSVVHRVIELEQRRRSDGAVIGKSRIDVWRDAGRGLSVRRVYDPKGQLTTGVWLEEKPANGKPVRRVYRRGSGHKIDTGVQDPAKAIRDAELWQLDPSAIVFSALVNGSQAVRVSETADAYVVAYDAEQTRSDGLLQAILTLRKADLHPIAQSLVINDGRETYEYKFVEVVFERPRLDLVSPGVFEPDAEFVSTTEAPRATSAKHPLSSFSAPAPAAELEVDVAYALDRFRTRFGDQLNLIRTPMGVLEVRGVVDDDETRKEIVGELSRIAPERSALRIQLDTTAEVLARKTQASGRVIGRVIVRDFAGADQSIPLHAELSRYFAAHEGAGQTAQYRDQLVREFAARVIGRSQRAVAHSLELKQLGSRFSAAQLDQFTPSARTKWVRLVRNHAEALQRELSTLDGELRRILFANESGKPAAERAEISTSAAMLNEIDRLHPLVVAIDQAVRSSFAASSGAVTPEGVNKARFRGELATALRLAEEIRQAVTEK
jgi:RNA polymerase sigma factor (sigma-70 family)